MTKTLTFYWSPQRQSFACDQDVSNGHGTIPTDPSHDLAHLIIAANGNMAWKPEGDRTQVCWAEYNAVFLEHLFNQTCNAIVFGTSDQFDTLSQTVDYMAWFVDEHYSPFPVSAAIAARRFYQRINAYQASQLFPYYLQVKRHERTHDNYRESEYHLVFKSTDHPPVDELGWLAQWSIYHQLKHAQHQLGIAEDEQSARLDRAWEAIASSVQSEPSSTNAIPVTRDPGNTSQRLQTLENQHQQLLKRLTQIEKAIADPYCKPSQR